MRFMNRYINIFLLLIVVLLVSCSTTSKLKDSDVLYTGVKKINYVEDSIPLDDGVKDTRKAQKRQLLSSTLMVIWT